MWLINTNTSSGNSFTGSIRGNTINQNERFGLALWETEFTGDIATNQISGNTSDASLNDAGMNGPRLDVQIPGLALFNGSELSGNIIGNTISSNSGAGLLIERSNILGNIESNEFIANSTEGIFVTNNATLTGDISNNQFETKLGEGIRLDFVDSLVRILDNRLSGNNGGLREVSVTNSPVFLDFGHLDLTLSGNSSLNDVVTPDFNYFIDNPNDAGFNLTSDANIGTIGGPDGQIP